MADPVGTSHVWLTGAQADGGGAGAGAATDHVYKILLGLLVVGVVVLQTGPQSHGLTCV